MSQYCKGTYQIIDEVLNQNFLIIKQIKQINKQINKQTSKQASKQSKIKSFFTEMLVNFTFVVETLK